MEFFNDVGEDPLKPSLFELIAQEQLKDLLQPALKYVLAVRLCLFSRMTLTLHSVGLCTTVSPLFVTHRQPARGVLCRHYVHR